MKKQLFLILTISIFFTNIASAKWIATIHAQGEHLKGQSKSVISIGVADKIKQVSAPPTAPLYSCEMVLYDSNWTKKLAKDIHQENGENTNSWIIAINPGGNVASPFASKKSTIKWNPSQFGDGTFKLISGWKPDGECVIPDMRLITQMDIWGGNETLFFLIIQEKDFGTIN
ncbi:MAG: hypothetical protein HQK75_13190 [Candidatus Magnetomorum sp.]|nr:hypothetical protein [Candidatus Magnetomorum sp.]